MLNISEMKKKDFEALLAIVGLKMKMGLITDSQYQQTCWVKPRWETSILVDVKPSACDTVACIGGWMALEAGFTEQHYVRQFVNEAQDTAEMTDLFIGYGLSGRSLTIKDALRAIDRYFAGKHPWKNVKNYKKA